MKDDLRSAKFAIDIGPTPSLPISGSDQRFPVGRIYCVGRNYAEHAREMGHDPDREDPFFFTKPADALLINGADMP
ncbi:MAG TPA: fumarylacetoacetate hydrolase family protein, partial [Usitatibacter sp.]|nr:fumarylacetoacetate hydrolase family protein [Usitatibacter sp.]